MLVQIYSTAENGAVSSRRDTLIIAYDASGAEVVDEDVILSAGAKKLEIWVEGVLTGGAPYPNLLLEADITDIEATHFLSSGQPQMYCLKLNYNPAGRTITFLLDNGVTDPGLLNATEYYELEWIYINDFSYNPDGSRRPKYAMNGYIPYDFSKNATRVRLSGNEYEIPCLYESGYVVVRYRRIGFWSPNFSTVYPWSLSTKGSLQNPYDTQVIQPAACSALLKIFDTWAHEPSLNWKASTTFAEDAKHKSAIEYYDGTMRTRQVVAQDNDKDIALVSETYYDYMGRPALSILPSPAMTTGTGAASISSVVQYYDGFTRNTGGSTLGKDDFDLDTPAPEGEPVSCAVQAQGLGTQSGAGRYYSSANTLTPFEDAGVPSFQSFVPDAEGYPYRQVEYMPDNTGRIKRQSGVGKAHRLGSNHEVSYMYGPAPAFELERLFGDQVGNAEHYFKTVTFDPNGVASVAYENMRGQTIATGLTGDAPGNLDPVYNQNAIPEPSRNVLTQNEVRNNEYIESAYTLLVVSEQESYDFAYELDFEEIVDKYNLGPDPTCASCDFCPSCVFSRIELSIVDDCGTNYLCTSGQSCPAPYVVTPQDDNGEALGTPNTSCSLGGTACTGCTGCYTQGRALHLSFPGIVLPRGSYSVEKRLYLDLNVIEQYSLDLINSPGCLNPPAPTACPLPDACACCEGLEPRVVDQSPAEAVFFTLLGDVSPTGQFGELPVLNPSQEDLAASRLSIFTPNANIQGPNELGNVPVELLNPSYSNIPRYWANVLTADGCVPTANGLLRDEFDATGKARYMIIPDEVKAEFIELNDLNPALVTCDASFINLVRHQFYTTYLTAAGRPPGDHASWGSVADTLTSDQIRNNWQYAFAYLFVYQHPEYNHYRWMKTVDAALAYDERMQQTDSYAEALSQGFLNPLGLSSAPAGTSPGAGTPATDPIISPALEAVCGMKATLEDRFTDYVPALGLDIWEFALAIHRRCAAMNSQAEMNHCLSSGPGFGDQATTTAEERDMLWQQFRGIYLSIKRDAMERCKQNGQFARLALGTDGALTEEALYGSVANPLGGRRLRRILKHETSNLYQQLQEENAEDEAGNIADGGLCNAGCEAGAESWLIDYADCLQPVYDLEDEAREQNILAQIKQAWVSICKTGCTGTRFYGYRKDPAQDRDFATVLASMLAANGLAHSPVKCALYLSNTPAYPGYSYPAPGAELKPADQCACDLLNQALADWNAKTPEQQQNYPGTDKDYIRSYIHRLKPGSYTLPLDLIEQLYCQCQGRSTCADASKPPLLVPAQIACDECRGLQEITTAREAYNTYAASIGLSTFTTTATEPYYTLANPSQVLWFEPIFANYMNVRLGSAFSFGQYMRYLGSSPGPQDKLCPEPFTLPEDTCPCEADERTRRTNDSLALIAYYDRVRREFKYNFAQRCLNNVRQAEAFTATRTPGTSPAPPIYQVTLYYYDQAGNLVKTLPPEAIRTDLPLHTPPGTTQPQYHKNHALATTYTYNSLNQITSQTTPDGGTVRYWYDRLGRILMSQDADQRLESDTSHTHTQVVSYSLYDHLNRVTEAGELRIPTSLPTPTPTTTAQLASLRSLIANPSPQQDPYLHYSGTTLPTYSPILAQLTSRVEITRLWYDTPHPHTPTLGISPTHTRNRVAATTY
ncbi:MAG: hypothetical protein LW884_06050, partial [Bacteroidetes bacterium]|nr:hypothetical protein [Bacteroidota bacterium]